MFISVVVSTVMSVVVVVTCQQPLDDLSEISPYLSSGNLEKSLLQQCESFAQILSDENERLKSEVKILKTKIEALEQIEEEEEDDGEEEDDERDGRSAAG